MSPAKISECIADFRRRGVEPAPVAETVVDEGAYRVAGLDQGLPQRCETDKAVGAGDQYFVHAQAAVLLCCSASAALLSGSFSST